MTDKEIIKAFDCCIGDTDGKDCFGCPLYEIDDCQAHLNLDALDLINRQKAEIEQQKAKCVKCGEKTTKTILNLQELLAEKNADIDMLNNNISIMVATMSNSTKDTKAEAYKEFAEKLKKELSFGKYIQSDQIDNLLKEMVGDN